MGNNWCETLIVRIITTLICFFATEVVLSQTEVQKQMIFEHINRDSRTLGLVSKIEPIENKEALFKKAQVLPVYQVVFDKTNRPKFIQKEKYYLVYYIGRLYVFVNSQSSRFFEKSQIIKSINKFKSEDKKFKVVYFTESFSLDREILNPLFTNDAFDFIIDKGIKYTLNEFIDFKYGSLEKLKEIANLDLLREKITLIEYNNYLKTSYATFENYCPKDTSLVLKALTGQIRLATKDFSKGQETKLIHAIKQKINPFERTKQFFNSKKHSDSITKVYELELNKIKDEHKKSLDKVQGNYEFKIYGVSFTNELLETLTNKQFIDYVKFVNLMNPPLDSLNLEYNRTQRYFYGKEILIKKEIVKYDNFNYFKSHLNKILEDCGCLFDETIKRNVIIR